MVAARAARSAHDCSLSLIAPGDEIRLSVLGVDQDKARAALANVLAITQRCYGEAMRGDPLKNSFKLDRDTDKNVAVEVAIAALAKGGQTVVSRWSAGALFTEAPRMIGEEDGARNLDESLMALRNRMLDGSVILIEGSPYQPFGPVFDLDKERFGKPDEDVIVCKAPGRLLWPDRYTPDYCSWLQRTDANAYETDVLGNYIDPPDSLFATADVLACIEPGVTRREPILDERGQLKHEHVAAMDPATRSAKWTLVVLRTLRDGPRGLEYEQVLAKEWQGSSERPLKPWDVLTEARDLCAPYGVTDAFTDQASFDALADIGDRVGFGLTGLFGGEDSHEKDCEALHPVIAGRRIRLLDNPQQRVDLQRVSKRITSNGYSYQYPTSGNGSGTPRARPRHSRRRLDPRSRHRPTPPGTSFGGSDRPAPTLPSLEGSTRSIRCPVLLSGDPPTDRTE
jgi:hypothetical protein